MGGYWPLAITLFTTTFALAAGVFFWTRLRADRAESKHKHFGGVPHRSVFGMQELDMSMSARERLDARAPGKRFRETRTQEILREERDKAA